ncbi:hypothetical protein TWF970_009016 [Orbilia oligospora]|uniref:Uncharacterized protein n=1 Tax=Orbilia oligospora TaxID=2813651 RepID=A0A7C8V1T0_ORBOL|nr:hypothetical protein TWF970_009016 [Orbilia oligospora]
MSRLNQRSQELSSLITSDDLEHELDFSDLPPYYDDIITQELQNLETQLRLGSNQKPHSGTTSVHNAQFLSVNREYERREALKYHLVITQPVMCVDTEPSPSTARAIINTFFVRLFRRCGHTTSPLRFRGYKLERKTIDGETSYVLLIGLKPQDGSIVTDHVGSLVRCLFNKESQDIISSFSELGILGISPVKGSSIQRQWDMELLGDIRNSRQFLETLKNSADWDTTDRLIREMESNEWYRIVSFTVALGIDLMGLASQKPSNLLKMIFGAEAIPADQLSDEEQDEGGAQANAEGALVNITRARERRIQDLQARKERAAKSMNRCSDAISTVIEKSDLMTRPALSPQDEYQFLNALTTCVREAADALTYDLNMLESFLQAFKDHKRRLKEQRLEFMKNTVRVLYNASVISAGLIYSDWPNMTASVALKIILQSGTIFEAARSIWCGMNSLYATFSGRGREVNRELATARNVATTLLEVWNMSAATYIFATQTKLINGKRVFLNDNIQKEWTSCAATGILGASGSEGQLDGAAIGTLVRCLEINKLRLMELDVQLKEAVSKLQGNVSA